MSSLKDSSRCRKGEAGFTLVEILFAAVILSVGIAAAAVCMQLGVKNYDTARTTLLVSNALQDEAERLRLENWASICALGADSSFTTTLPVELQDTLLTQVSSDRGLTFTRSITDADGRDGLKEIHLSAQWTGVDGIVRSRSMRFYYAKGGISDYYYGSVRQD